MQGLSPNYQEFAQINDQNLNGLLKTAVPPESEYNTLHMGPAGSRAWVEFNADNQSYTNKDSKIVIKINSKGILAFRKAHLEFNLAVGATGSSAVFRNGVWGLFERMSLVAGSTLAYDQFDKDNFWDMQWSQVRATESDATLGDACLGVSTLAKRITRSSGANYLLFLNMPPLGSDEVPFANLGNQMQIELYLKNPMGCVCYTNPSAGSNPTYTITNMRLRCEEVFYQPDYQNMLTSAPFILLPFTQGKLTMANLPSGSSINSFQVFQSHYQSVKRLNFYFRNQADLNNPAVMDVGLCEFNKAGIISYQGKLDNTRIPQLPVKCSYAGGENDSTGYQEGYLNMVDGMARYEVLTDYQDRKNNGLTQWALTKDVLFTESMYNNQNFVGVLDFKTFDVHSDQFLTKLNLQPGNTTLTLYTNHQTGYPLTNQVLYMWLIHNGVTVISNTGKCFLIE
jgi:hypothetical protein